MRVDQFVVVVVMIVVVTGYALETNEADRTFSTATEVKNYICTSSHALFLCTSPFPECISPKMERVVEEFYVCFVVVVLVVIE